MILGCSSIIMILGCSYNFIQIWVTEFDLPGAKTVCVSPPLVSLFLLHDLKLSVRELHFVRHQCVFKCNSSLQTTVTAHPPPPMRFWLTLLRPPRQFTSILLLVCPKSTRYWSTDPCWSNSGQSDWPRELKGKVRIDLFVVLGNQLIPILCASIDRTLCLIWYGLA